MNDILLGEMPEHRQDATSFPQDLLSQRGLLRSLMNLRPPSPISPEFLCLQDALLGEETIERGVVDALSLPRIQGEAISLWQGDITRLDSDAIVNAANSDMLGCFYPCHSCIDNAIHSASGLQLREACAALMAKQGHPEAVGNVKVTAAYNLPSRFVFHTVGPRITRALTQNDRDLLESCYVSCLTQAREMQVSSIAFCCISTGEFHFPPEEAATIAINTVRSFQKCDSPIPHIIFTVFKDSDRDEYARLLNS